jgi:hypothetical protein
MLLAHHGLFNLCPDETRQGRQRTLSVLTIYAAEIAT